MKSKNGRQRVKFGSLMLVCDSLWRLEEVRIRFGQNEFFKANSQEDLEYWSNLLKRRLNFGEVNYFIHNHI